MNKRWTITEISPNEFELHDAGWRSKDFPDEGIEPRTTKHTSRASVKATIKVVEETEQYPLDVIRKEK